MNSDWIIWASLVLLAFALVWMTVLILVRLIRDYGAARRNLERRALIDLLVRLLLTDEAQLQVQLAAYATRAPLMAEVVLELQVLVRGQEQSRLFQRLLDLNLDQVFIARLQRAGRTRRLYAEALAALGGPAASAALARLAADERNPETRLAALRFAARSGEGPTLDQLLDDALHGRLVASRLLADLLRQATLADLEAAQAALLRSDLTALLRAMLLDALAASGDYAVLPSLLAAASHVEPETRTAAVRGLGRMMHPDGEPAIAAGVLDQDWRVRTAAAEAAGRARLARLTPQLRRLLDDPEWWVRLRAGEALAALGQTQRELSAA